MGEPGAQALRPVTPCAGSCTSTSTSSWPRWNCAAAPTWSAGPSSSAATATRPSRARSSRARRTRPASSACTPACRCAPPPAAAPTPPSCRRIPAAYDAASEQVMGLLRDLGHPLEVWGWDEAYLGADTDDPGGTRRADPHRHRRRDRAVVLGRHQRQQAARQGRHRVRQAGRRLHPHRRQLDGRDGRAPRRRAVGRRTQDHEKACRPGYHDGPRTGLRRRRAADLDLRPAHRAVAAAARQGRRRREGQRGAVGAALAQPRRHLPARSHRPRRNGFGGNRIGAASAGRDRRAGPHRDAGRGHGAHRHLLHPHQDPQARATQHRPRR